MASVVSIPLKNNKTVLLNQDIIEFEDIQINYIKERSTKKELREWLKEGSSAIKVRMNDTQKHLVLEFKEAFISVFAPDRSAKTLRESEYLIFTRHSIKRVRERLIKAERERLKEADKLKELLGLETSADIFKKEIESEKFHDEIYAIFIDSKELDDFFNWKAYSDVSFKFYGMFREIYKIGIAIAFSSSEESFIVTVTLEEQLASISENVRITHKKRKRS